MLDSLFSPVSELKLDINMYIQKYCRFPFVDGSDSATPAGAQQSISMKYWTSEDRAGIGGHALAWFWRGEICFLEAE